MLYHYLIFDDPTGQQPYAHLFMNEKMEGTGAPRLRMVGHEGIFREGGLDLTKPDWDKIAKYAANLQPNEPILLNVEGHVNTVHSPTLVLNQEAVDRRIAIVDAFRAGGPPGLQLGFFEQLPVCIEEYVFRDDLRPRWRILNQELMLLATRLNVIFLECYPKSYNALGKTLWYMRETVGEARKYNLPVYVMIYPMWIDKRAKAKKPKNNNHDAQMRFRIPGDYFAALLKQAAELADHVIVFGAYQIPWYDDEADWFLKLLEFAGGW